MEKAKGTEIEEFYELMAAITDETASLKTMILSDENGEEENEILRKFDGTLQGQIFSTLTNLTIYQLSGWKALLDE